jgi:hypothetical protein
MVILGIPPETWFPVVTLIIGLVLKAVFDMTTDWRTASREREARQDQRRDAFRRTHIEFQRATLLELQEAIQQLARCTGQAHQEDVLASRAAGAWKKQPLTKEVNEDFLRARTSIILLRVRVRDEEIRRLAELFSSACNATIFSETEGAAHDALQLRVIPAVTDLHERIGTILRSLDDDEDRIASA